jgi:hypothetical protein
MADQKLNIKITEDVQKNPLKELQAELRKLAVEQQNLYVNGQKNSQIFQENANKIRVLKDAVRELQGVSKGLSGAGGLSRAQLLEMGENITVIGTGVRYAAQQVFNFGKQMLNAGANLTVARSNFKGSAEDIQAFNTALAGNLLESQIINLSNRLTDLGYSVDQQTQIFFLAEKAADSYGVSLEEAFEKSVKAIEKNGAGLERMGVSSRAFKERVEELALAQGFAVDELDAFNNRQIKFQALMELSNTTLQDAKNNTQDVGDKMTDLSLSFDKFLESAGASLITTIQFNEEMGNLGTTASKSGVSFGELLGELINIGAWIDENKFIFSPVAAGLELIVGWAIDAKNAIFDVQDAISDTSSLFPSLDERVKGVTDKVIPTIEVSSTQRETRRTGSRGGTVSKEKAINYLSERFLGVSITNLAADVNKLLADKFFQISATPVGLGGLTFGEGLEFAFGGQPKPFQEAFDAEEFKNTFNTALTDSQTIVNILGSADMSRMLQDLQTGISLASSIFNLISLAAGGGGGGLFGFLGGLFGGDVATRGGLPSPNSVVNKGTAYNINITGKNKISGKDIVQSYNATIREVNQLAQF